MPTRTLSSDTMTLHSMSPNDQMADSDIRAYIQSNIHVLYDPSTAPQIHIATSRSPEGNFLAFLVKQHDLAKALSTTTALCSEPRPTRNAAMLSLLEATESRITERLRETINKNSQASNNSATISSSNIMTTLTTAMRPESQQVTRMPTDASSINNRSVDYGEKPKDKSFITWRKPGRNAQSVNNTTKMYN